MNTQLPGDIERMIDAALIQRWLFNIAGHVQGVHRRRRLSDSPCSDTSLILKPLSTSAQPVSLEDKQERLRADRLVRTATPPFGN